MFVGMHALLSERTNTPELAIGFDEGAQFMRSAQNVMRHYSVETTQKTLDWISFAGVAAGIYGTRVAAIMVRRKAEAAERGDQTQMHFRSRRRENVTPLRAVEPGAVEIRPDAGDDHLAGFDGG